MRLLAIACLMLPATVSQAQITVQQPVIQSNGVRTTVSVPDRGRVFLGGVSSADSFRQSNGPFPSSVNRGSGLSGGSMSASVYVIDLQAMDEAILNSVPDSPVPQRIAGRSRVDGEGARSDTVPVVDKAVNFERLAKQAESNGKPGVAKLHWQMAAKYGSTIAQEKLNNTATEVAKAAANRK